MEIKDEKQGGGIGSQEKKSNLKQKAKKAFKWLIVLFVAFVVVTFIVARLYDYLQEKTQLDYISEIERPYREDTYGGDTPEETLQLFIDALKAGDTDLASKYFVPEKQEEMKGDLAAGMESGGVDVLLEALEAERKGKSFSEENYRFTSSVVLGEEEGKVIIDLFLNPFTNKWKIESL